MEKQKNQTGADRTGKELQNEDVTADASLTDDTLDHVSGGFPPGYNPGANTNHASHTVK